MDNTTGQPPSPETRKRPRYFYGWNIVGTSFLASLSNAEQNSSILGLFFRPLNAEFGWSRTSIAGVQSFTRILEGLIATIIGPILDRHGPRRLMFFGGLVAGLAFVSLSRVDSLWQFYLLRGGLMAVGFGMAGGLVPHTAISNWFVRRRGRAIAIGHMGSHLGNTITAPLTVLLLASAWGWQGTFLIFGFLTWIVIPVPALLFMRRRPEDMGLYPDGIPPEQSQENSSDAEDESPGHLSSVNNSEPVWTRSEVIRTPSFWFLVVSFSVATLSLQGINISLGPYIQDLGYGSAMLAIVMGSRTMTQLVISPIWGLAAEHAELPIIRVLPFVLQGLSCVFFLLAAQVGFLWLAVLFYALGNAGARIVQGVLWAGYFGRLSLGTVRSTASPINAAVAAAGPLFMNMIFDITGSYRLAYLIFIAFYTVAVFLVWNCHPPKAARYARADEF